VTTFVIVPVKKLEDAKSRLSPLLLDNERREFCLKMLEDVLASVKTTRHVNQTVVMGKDEEAFHVAKGFDAVPLTEGQSGLNQAVSEAISWCIQRGATSTLILPADIPLVTPMDLNRILSLGEEAAVVISPSRSGSGTNALLLNPPNVIPTFYGQHSFQRHIEEASIRAIRFRTVRSSRIALDIDTVEDLAYFAALKHKETRSHRFLERIGVLKRLTEPP